jgi:hypothetical protein
MSSTVQIYTNKVEIEEQDKGSKLVTLENVDASDFVNEFIAEEILDAMDFSVIHKYVTDRADDEADFSGCGEGER